MRRFLREPRYAVGRAVLVGILCVLCGAGIGFWQGAGKRSAHEVAAAARVADRYEWGLSFQTEGEPPVPNLSAEALAPYHAYFCAGGEQKRLYLTFDAGYENGNTTPILDALAKHHAPAAFFVVGPYIKEYPDLVKRMTDEGHIVGNHTYHHPDMSQKGREAFVQELADVEALYLQLTGKEMPRFYRPPEGKFSTENLEWANALGYKTVFWGLAYVDWNPDAQPTREKAFDKLLPRTFPGAVVLLHSTSATNAAILDELLTRWEDMGYTFGRLDELGAAPTQSGAPSQAGAAEAASSAVQNADSGVGAEADFAAAADSASHRAKEGA